MIQQLKAMLNKNTGQSNQELNQMQPQDRDPFGFNPSMGSRGSMHTSETTRMSHDVMDKGVSQGVKGAGGSDRLMSTMQNIQKVAGMVESARPVMAEYGPYLKGIPNLLKSFKSDKEKEEKKQKSGGEKRSSRSSSHEPIKESEKKSKNRKPDEKSSIKKASYKSKEERKASQPKLYL